MSFALNFARTEHRLARKYLYSYSLASDDQITNTFPIKYTTKLTSFTHVFPDVNGGAWTRIRIENIKNKAGLVPFDVRILNANHMPRAYDIEFVRKTAKENV